jgi:2-aminoethylphosphonate-pyruvate transaminase
MNGNNPSSARDKTLFTPGPLTTSLSVKQEMLRDAGSWHYEFNEQVRQIREDLLSIAGVSKSSGYECVLMQGSGSFGVEAAISTVTPRGGKILIPNNGAYGDRMIKMARQASIDFVELKYAENEAACPEDIRKALEADPSITTVAVVHCETTTGILNPIDKIGPVVKAAGRTYIVDAMSSFGAVPIDFNTSGIDTLISSANKCLEGVPGFSFVILRRAVLEGSEGNSRSLCLDLVDQWKAFETRGQFRYTPPTHSLLAFRKALEEFRMEGGVEGRSKRYQSNYTTLIKGMSELGFEVYLPKEKQSYIINSFYFPEHPNFEFKRFYKELADRNLIIYPGKLTEVNCFRIGSIGRIFPSDVEALLAAIRTALTVMNIPLPLAPIQSK